MDANFDGKDNLGSDAGAFDVNKLQKLRSKVVGKKTENPGRNIENVGDKVIKAEPKNKVTKKNRVWDEKPPDYTDPVTENGAEIQNYAVAVEGESMMDKEEVVSSGSEDEEDELESGASVETKKKGWFSTMFQRDINFACNMASEEVLKAIFPFLEGTDLASCMSVCKNWREIARDEYLWKCLCAKKWPSICKRPTPPTMTYYKIYSTFYRCRQREIVPPRLSLDDLNFYIDIWAEDELIFSEVVPGPPLKTGIKIPEEGISDIMRAHLGDEEYKMTLPVEPRFSVPLSQTVSVSMLVGRKDCNKVASIINMSCFDYIDRTSYRALAFNYLDFSPLYPFVSGVRAWISLLFMDDGNEGVIDVFGIQMEMLRIPSTRCCGCSTCLTGSERCLKSVTSSAFAIFTSL